MLFNNPKVIFIHMPKTGGSSIEYLFARSPWLLERDGQMGQHERMERAAKRYDDLSDYKMFTVMRNTYQRVVSLYCMYYARGGQGFKRMGMVSKKPYQKRYVTFPDFYNRMYEIWQTKQQKQVALGQDFWWYNGIDGVIPDNMEVIDFDNLEEEFKELWCGKWGFEMNIEFPHTNQNKKSATDSSLRSYLVRDPEFRKIIEEVYEKEIDHFSYTPY